MILVESAFLRVPNFSDQLGVEKNIDKLYLLFKDYNTNILKSVSVLDGVMNNLSNLNIPTITHFDESLINILGKTLIKLIGNG